MGEDVDVAEGGDVVGTEVDIQITKMDIIVIKVFFLASRTLAGLGSNTYWLLCICYIFILTENGGYSNWGRGASRGGWGYRGSGYGRGRGGGGRGYGYGRGRGRMGNRPRGGSNNQG
ncbi:unnamed protein product [Withania somnifera]